MVGTNEPPVVLIEYTLQDESVQLIEPCMPSRSSAEIDVDALDVELITTNSPVEASYVTLSASSRQLGARQRATMRGVNKIGTRACARHPSPRGLAPVRANIVQRIEVVALADAHARDISAAILAR